MAILTLVATAATANDGDLISGKVIAGIFAAIFAAGGGIWIGKRNGEKDWAKRESDLRAEIANELRTRIINDPLHVQNEQTAGQAWWKDNAKDHADIFNRLRNNESAIATLMERSIAQGKTLDRMADQVGSLYDRIICRGKKK